MNYLQMWWIIMVLSGYNLLVTQQMDPSQQQQQHDQEKLLDFHRAVNEARQELDELRLSFDEKADAAGTHRQRRDSIDDMLASFAQDASKEQEDNQDDKALQRAADAWFRDFQAGGQSREGLKQARAVPNKDKDKAKTFLDNYAKSMERTEIGKVKLKYKNVPDDTIILQSERKNPYLDEESNTATQLDIKLKQVQQLLHDHEDNQARQRLFRVNSNRTNVKSNESEKLPQFGDGLIPDGVYEQTLARLNFPHLPLKANNFSHEANYKLSKIEQEAAEHSLPKPIRFPFKRSSNNFNPMNEIKLKTSNRLMRRGMGPSLPSNSLTETRRVHLVDDLINRRERNMQQREQRAQPQFQENADSLMPQFETYSFMSPSSNLDARDGMRQEMDTPQSYDYRLPQYDQFHSLNQRPNMRDYARVKDLERFKREPDTKISLEANKLAEHDENLDQKTAIEGDQQQQQTADANADQQQHHREESANTNKLETSVEEHRQPEDKPLESLLKGEVKLESSKSEEESVQSSGETKQEAVAKCESSPEVEAKAEVEKDKDDATLSLNIKLKVEDPVKSAAATAETDAEATETGESTSKVDSSKKSQGIKVNSEAVVKLLANEISQMKNDPGRGKRAIVRKPRRQHRRSKRSLDEMEEDHNGKHLQVGSLALDPEEEETYAGDSDFLEHYDPYESLSLGQQFVGNPYDNARNQVPMLNPRQQQQVYQTIPQQQGQYPQLPQQHQQQQQQQPQQQQQLPQQQQQLPQQQQQLPQQQQQQIIHQPSNFKASFNLSHFFNELSKLQKLQQPHQQQQQPIYQQPQQYSQQQQYPQQLQPQQHHQQAAQMNSIPKAIPNESKSILQMKQSPVHRYLGPFFNKQSKVNMLGDPCITTVAPLTTINPNCVSITQPPAIPTMTTTTLPAPAATLSTVDTNITSELTTIASAPISNATAAIPEVATTPATTTVTPMDNICNNPDVMKLNVSINANVCGDPKTKQFYGNGSINLQPGYERLTADYEIDDTPIDEEQDQDHALVDEINEDIAMDTEERYARQARRHKQKAQKEKRKDAKHKPNRKDSPPAQSRESVKCGTGAHDDNDRDESCTDSFEKLISGRTSEDIVNAVFDVVSNDPSMDRLAAVLERNRKCLQKKPKNFYQIRNDQNDQFVERTQEMIRETMQAISGIIDKQVRQRACIPLRPDLLEFYDTIVKTMAEQQKCREKRESSLQSLSDDFSQDVRSLDSSKIEQKSRIVKKLLRQYDELPMEDQRSVANIRDELLMDLVFLRKMADAADRIQRNAQLNEALGKSKHSDVLISGEFSPRFIKLLRAADLFKGSGEQQAKTFIGL